MEPAEEAIAVGAKKEGGLRKKARKAKILGGLAILAGAVVVLSSLLFKRVRRSFLAR